MSRSSSRCLPLILCLTVTTVLLSTFPSRSSFHKAVPTQNVTKQFNPSKGKPNEISKLYNSPLIVTSKLPDPLTSASSNFFYQKNSQAKSAHFPTSWYFLLKFLYPAYTNKFSGNSQLSQIYTGLHDTLSPPPDHNGQYITCGRAKQLKSSSQFIRTFCM